MSFKFQDWVLKSQDCLVHLPVNVNRGVLHTHAQNTRDLLVSGGEKCMSYLLTGISPTERANWKPSSQLSPEAAQCPHMETLSTEACVRAKSRQSSPTLCDLMDCSPQGSSVDGDSPGKNIRVGCHSVLHGIFLTQGSNWHLLCLSIAGGFFTTEPPRKPH